MTRSTLSGQQRWGTALVWPMAPQAECTTLLPRPTPTGARPGEAVRRQWTHSRSRARVAAGRGSWHQPEGVRSRRYRVARAESGLPCGLPSLQSQRCRRLAERCADPVRFNQPDMSPCAAELAGCRQGYAPATAFHVKRPAAWLSRGRGLERWPVRRRAVPGGASIQPPARAQRQAPRPWAQQIAPRFQTPRCRHCPCLATRLPRAWQQRGHQARAGWGEHVASRADCIDHVNRPGCLATGRAG